MAKTNPDYKMLTKQLDEVLAAMQSPDLTVDEAIAHYEKGIQLVEDIETYLKQAEHKITKLKSDV